MSHNYSASGEGEVKVKKTLEGREWATDDSFEFTITPVGDAPAFENNKVTVTKNSSDYTESFGTVTFTEAGTYQWTVSETHKGQTIDGVAYDSEDKTVTIVVKDDGKGNLVAEEGSDLVQTAEFTNNYSASGEGEIKVKKNLVGRAWATDDTFEFTITPVGNAPAFDNNTVTVTKNSTGYTESFGKVKFTETGTYQWTVSETHKGQTIDGVAYDSADKTVTIVVKDDGKGNLVAEEGSDLVQTAEFTNNYSASGEGEIKVKKNLVGREWATDDSFEFTLEPINDSPMPETNGIIDAISKAITGSKTVTVTKESKDFTESFGKIKFAEAGTYSWKVVEKHKGETIDGVAYDSADKTVTIVVKDDGKGNLVAEEGSALVQTAEFTNNYSASGEGEIKVNKNLVGRAWATDDTFEFTITPVGDAPAFKNNTVTVTKNSTGYTESFGKVTFTKAGTYEWTVSETHKGETIDGVAYDRADKTVTIVVKDDGKGNLVAEEGSALVKTAEFTNTYAKSGTGEVKVQKNLSGREWTTDDSFEFTIKPVGDAPEFKNNTVTVTKNSTSYTESFGKVTFTEAGTYQWTVSEAHKGETIDGIDYADSDKTVTITVVDNGKGELVAEEGSALVQTAEFTNNYSATGEGEVKVQKNLSGREWTTDDSFEFTITPVGNAPAFDSNTVTVTKNSSDYTESFGTVTFTEAGTYQWTVSEAHKGETIDGIDYADSDKTVTITVVDNGKGNLVAEEGSALVQTAEFTNNYSASGEGEVKVKKTLEGREWATDDSFEFTITPVGDAPKFANNKVIVSKDSASYTESFGTVTFTEAGKYQWTVSEAHKGETIDGIDYADSDKTVTITVVDNGKGELVAEEGNALVQTAEFTNTYSAKGDVALSALKELTGRKLKAGEFSFELKDADGKVLQTKTNASDGTVTFDAIKYTLPDVANSPFTYTISEVVPADKLGGVTYDTREETITVTLKDNKDGTITATPDKTGASVKFTNNYDAKGSIELEGTKTIENREFKDGDSWTFSVEAETDGAPVPDPGKVTINPTSGYTETIEYGTIDFTLSDLGGKTEKTFKYKITESGTVDGVTNDSRTHTLTLTVRDNGDGTLSVTKKEKGGGLSFTNTYKTRKTVKTGDETNLLMPIVTFIGSLILLIIAFILHRRNRSNNN